MNVTEHWNAESGLAATVFRMWRLYGPIQSLMISIAHATVFSIRAEPLDLALQRPIRFGTERYRIPQDYANSSIRIQEHMTRTRLLAFGVLVSKQREQCLAPVGQVLSQIADRENSIIFGRATDTLNSTSMHFIAFQTPVLMVLNLCFFAPAYLLALAWRRTDRPCYRNARLRAKTAKPYGTEGARAEIVTAPQIGVHTYRNLILSYSSI